MPKEMKLPVPENLEALLDEIQAKNDPAINVAGSVNRYLEMKAREKGVPIHGMFELTPLCNLDCKMCYVHLTKEQMGDRKLLTVDQWKTLIDQAVDAGMLNATLTGGECLTYPGFDEIYLHLLSQGIRVSILTNGLLLSKERILFFEKYPPKGIQITVYGSSEEEYEAVSGRKVFDIVMSNIKMLSKTRIPLSISITPSRYHFDGAKQLVKLIDSLGVHYSVNSSLIPPNADTGRSEQKDDLSLKEYIELFKYRKILNGRSCIPYTGELPKPSTVASNRRGMLCAAGMSSFNISWQGVMSPCGSIEGIDEYPLVDGFSTCWQAIHDAAVNYQIPGECGNCVYNGYCPICVVTHQLDAPIGHASHSCCERIQAYIRAGVIDVYSLEGVNCVEKGV